MIALIGDGKILRSQLDDVLARNGEKFTPEQAESILMLMEEVAEVEGSPSRAQRELMASVRNRLPQRTSSSETWG